MTEQLHPLLAWWAVLFALSSLTRYEPVKWAAMSNIDSSPEANAVEVLLLEALTAVPYIVFQLFDAQV